MGMDETPMNTQTSVSKHAFCDLSHVSPLVFLYLLRKCYVYGTCKASEKFRALKQQLYLVLLDNSQIGPATLIAQCLCIAPIFESDCVGLSRLVLSALPCFLESGSNIEDVIKAKVCAMNLILDIIGGTVAHDGAIVIKIVQIFNINLMDIDEAICDLSGMKIAETDRAKEVVEQYVSKLIESESCMAAVDMLIHFCMRESGETVLLKVMEHLKLRAAKKWAVYMGKPVLCLLVQECVDRKLLEHAFDIIKKNNLHEEFPELYRQSKERELKRLAEKGVWEIAEARANGDRQLLEYLVYLAMEAGYSKKVEELCDRYSLKGFLNPKESESDPLCRRYLNIHKLSIEDVHWVDEVNGLRDAICYFKDCKVVGLDCEWKANYEKGSKPSKVSIMQIASEEKVYILDLLKLSEDVPSVLDECLARILHSPSILKLGYNFPCDVKQLANSYRELNCFKHFEMLLDIQHVFKEPRGGLSGLAEKILGAALDKTRRNSNWEQRPLSVYQLEYAALDAAVLVQIFRHVGKQAQPSRAPDGHAKTPWKSYIVTHMESS